MALIYKTLMRRQYLSMGIRAKLGTHAITIYAGTQPTPATVTANWAADYASSNANFLGHYQGASWSVPDSSDTATMAVPAAVNATNTGTAAWAILWAANPAIGVMGGAIPSAAFMVVPVGLSGGNGVIQLATLDFTSGVSKAIGSGTILVGG
jgi:hypothetical protein